MVNLPDGFTATKYDGYFWNIKDQKLYSIKIGGVLKPLKRHPAYQMSYFCFHGWEKYCDKYYYQISNKGTKPILTDKYLQSLKIVDSEIRILNEEIKN